MVTQNGNCSVGTVIGEDLRWDVVVRCKAEWSASEFSRAVQPQPMFHQLCMLTLTAEHSPLMSQPQHCLLTAVLRA